MTPFVLYTAATRTWFIASRLFCLHKRDWAFRLVEIHRAVGLNHSVGISENVRVFFGSPSRCVDSERLRPEIGSIGTNLCHDADHCMSVPAEF